MTRQESPVDKSNRMNTGSVRLDEEECEKFASSSSIKNWTGHDFGYDAVPPEIVYQIEIPSFQSSQTVPNFHLNKNKFQPPPLFTPFYQQEAITTITTTMMGDNLNCTNVGSVQPGHHNSSGSSSSNSSYDNNYDVDNDLFLNLSNPNKNERGHVVQGDRFMHQQQQGVHMTTKHDNDDDDDQHEEESNDSNLKGDESAGDGPDDRLPSYRRPKKSVKKERKRNITTYDSSRPPGRFVCDECQKSFTQKGNLQIHYRIHSGERPYKCDAENCEKAFSQFSHLQQHRRIHLDIRPYVCSVCGDSFRQMSNLDHHLTRKHGLEKQERRRSTTK